MMLSISVLVNTFLWGGLLCVAAYAVQKLQRWRNIAEIKSRYSCGEPTRYPHSNQWGSDLIEERAVAMKDGRWLRLYWDQHRQFGKTWVESVRGETTVNTMAPENFKHVFVSDYASFGKPTANRQWTQPLLGNSILNDGSHHRVVKALIKPVFSRAETHSEILKPFADMFMDLLPARGQQFDIMPLCDRLFLDFTTYFIFGKSVGSMENPDKGQEFLTALGTALKFIGKRRDAGWLGFRYSWNKECLQACRTIHRFIDAEVSRALREAEYTESKKENYAILDELARQIKDPIELRSQVIGMFLPAADTPAVALGNTLFELARHPEIWTRLRQIALSVREPLSFQQLRTPEFAEIRFVILETLRHIGPGALIQRFAKRDCILPCGGGHDQSQPIFVARGTRLHLVNSAWHREPSIWGDDAEEFNPDRWTGRENPPDFEWSPFIAGPRKCPAADTVLLHTAYFLVKLLQKYEKIKNEDTEEKYIEKWGMTHRNRHGVQISFE